MRLLTGVDSTWATGEGVNVSARQLRRRTLVDVVRELVERTGAPVERIVLEVTETALMERSDDVLATCTGCATSGCAW